MGLRCCVMKAHDVSVARVASIFEDNYFGTSFTSQQSPIYNT